MEQIIKIIPSANTSGIKYKTEELNLKKALIFIILTAAILFSGCSSTGSEEKLIGEINIGSTKNQVIEQMGYSEDYYNVTDTNLYYEDIKIFGQYCKVADFSFENNELRSISIQYTNGAEIKTIFKELEKAYGKNEFEFDFDDENTFLWFHNDALIAFSKGDDKLEPNILVLKNT